MHLWLCSHGHHEDVSNSPVVAATLAAPENGFSWHVVVTNPTVKSCQVFELHWLGYAGMIYSSLL